MGRYSLSISVLSPTPRMSVMRTEDIKSAICYHFYSRPGGRSIVNNPMPDLKGGWNVTGIRGEIRYGDLFCCA